MPLQNRVTPLGALERDPARGALTGNRGCLHDGAREIVRDYQLRRWIICVLEFKGRRAELMRPGFYTHLFFLDEATALAAGHRPCAECQRERFLAFRAAWAGGGAPGTPEIDEVLHGERLAPGSRPAAARKATYDAPLAELPDGAMVALGGAPHLLLAGRLLPWGHAGYGPAAPWPGDVAVPVLTPRSTVAALARGYAADVHPSALALAVPTPMAPAR